MGERDHFWNALRFLTIVPTPKSSGAMAPDWLARSIKYSPVIGIGIGFVSAMVLLSAGHLWGQGIAAMLAVAASIGITGALHEDGLADTFDAFGGGWTREKRLAIMKDSRIGTYGALALGIGVALRVAALAHLPPETGAAALIAVHAAARFAPALVMTQMSYAGDVSAMKVAYSEAPLRADEVWFAAMVVTVAVFPLVVVTIGSALSGLLCGALLAAALAAWSKRLIGGYTGDVLGAVEQVCEIGFLLGVAGVVFAA